MCDDVYIRSAVGLIQDTKPVFEQLPFGDGQSKLPAAGERGDIFSRPPLQSDGIQRACDSGARDVLIVESGKEIQVLTHREIIVKMLAGSQKSDGGAERGGCPGKGCAIYLDLAGRWIDKAC